MSVIRASDNTRVKAWSRLATQAKERRRLGLALIEGPHLFGAALDRHVAVESLIISESVIERPEIAQLVRRSGTEPAILADSVFRRLSDTESPAGIAAVIRIPPADDCLPRVESCVFLDGVQDAGNVGAILRTAAAFRTPLVVLGPGCADAWSPKVLRAGMGGHFHLSVQISEDLVRDFARFGGRIASTAVSTGSDLRAADLRGRLGWVFGSEGGGISESVASAATLTLRIPMPGGTESLNVAACAAICLYEHSRQTTQ